jgi:hypothetical protein
LVDDPRYSPQEFLQRMDSGEFDDNLYIELKKFSKEQLWELAVILLGRSAKPRVRPLPRLSARALV